MENIFIMIWLLLAAYFIDCSEILVDEELNFAWQFITMLIITIATPFILIMCIIEWFNDD